MRLAVEFGSRARTLLGPRGIASRHAVHLGHRHADLLDAMRLFPGGGGDLGHQAVGCGHLLRDLTERFSDASAAGRSMTAVGNRRLDLVRRLAGSGGAPLGQRSNLVGDHGEAGSGLAGPGGLDRRIEGEDVGLKRNLVDVLHNLGDLGARHLDGGHRLVHRDHRPRARLGRSAGLVRQILRTRRIVGRAPDHRRHLLERGARLHHRRTLLAAARGQRLAHARELAGGGRRLCGTAFKGRRHGPQDPDRRLNDAPSQQAGQQQGQRQCRTDENETHLHLLLGRIDLRLGHAGVVFNALVETIHALLVRGIHATTHGGSRRFEIPSRNPRENVRGRSSQLVTGSGSSIE